MDYSKDESAEVVSQLLQKKADTAIETVAAWPSGRTLQMIVASRKTGDRLVIRNPSGDLELCLEFGPSGPRLVVPGGALSVESEQISFQADCMDFNVKSQVNWQVEGDFNVHSNSTNLISTGDISINGRFVKLNCDQKGEHLKLQSDSSIAGQEN